MVSYWTVWCSNNVQKPWFFYFWELLSQRRVVESFCLLFYSIPVHALIHQSNSRFKALISSLTTHDNIPTMVVLLPMRNWYPLSVSEKYDPSYFTNQYSVWSLLYETLCCSPPSVYRFIWNAVLEHWNIITGGKNMSRSRDSIGENEERDPTQKKFKLSYNPSYSISGLTHSQDAVLWWNNHMTHSQGNSHSDDVRFSNRKFQASPVESNSLIH